MLATHLATYFGLYESDAHRIAGCFRAETLKKNEYYIQRDSFCRKLSFVTSGFVRIYGEHDGREITQWITSENEFLTEANSFFLNSPGRWQIQALTDCELYTISQEDFRRLGAEIPNWRTLESQFIAKCFTILENRVFSFLSMTAEERYKALFNMKKELFNHVPLHYLASMLGMTPETLSRIRRKALS